MIIYQPEDKTLTKERIEAILIVTNHMLWALMPSARADENWTEDFLKEINDLPNLKGRFTLSEKSEIVFVAQ